MASGFSGTFDKDFAACITGKWNVQSAPVPLFAPATAAAGAGAMTQHFSLPPRFEKLDILHEDTALHRRYIVMTRKNVRFWRYNDDIRCLF